MTYASPTVVRSVAGGGFLLIALLFSQFIGSTQTTDSQRMADKTNLALRRTAHHLLRATGDSTARIPPVQQPNAHTYEVRLARAFDYDQLPALLQESFRVYHITGAYDVAVLDCNRGELQLGYTVSDLIGGKPVPCEGRAINAGCYVLRVTFEAPVSPNSRVGLGLSLALGGLLVGFLFVVWRRAGRVVATETGSPIAKTEPIRFGQSSFDPDRQTLTIGLRHHKLTYREAKLLRLLTHHTNQVLERDAILKSVWGDEGVTVGRSLDVFVSRLRKLLHDDPTVRITAIHGVGYRLETEPLSKP